MGRIAGAKDSGKRKTKVEGKPRNSKLSEGGYRTLIAAIIARAIEDYLHPSIYNKGDLDKEGIKIALERLEYDTVSFLKSDYCRDLCELIDLNYNSTIKKVLEGDFADGNKDTPKR